jgi:hypothetical protein
MSPSGTPDLPLGATAPARDRARTRTRTRPRSKVLSATRACHASNGHSRSLIKDARLAREPAAHDLAVHERPRFPERWESYEHNQPARPTLQISPRYRGKNRGIAADLEAQQSGPCSRSGAPLECNPGTSRLDAIWGLRRDPRLVPDVNVAGVPSAGRTFGRRTSPRSDPP